MLEVDRRKSPDMEYEDDFTDAELSSVMTDGDVKKVNFAFVFYDNDSSPAAAFTTSQAGLSTFASLPKRVWEGSGEPGLRGCRFYTSITQR